MAKSTKAAELSAGLLAVKGAAAPVADMGSRVAAPPPEPEVDEDANNQPLNFRVTAVFRREFRTYAAQHDLKLNELLRLCFRCIPKGKSLARQKARKHAYNLSC